MRLWPHSNSQRVREFNPCHNPRGPKGGQFCSKDEAAPQPTSPDDKAGWDTYWQRKAAWEKGIQTAVTMGWLDPKVARGLGWYGDGNADKGYELLPPELYHVSTAYNDILRQGLKTREEIGGEHKGLGGGSDDTISFTTDLKTARAIRSAILEGRRVARGEITAEQMVRMAKAQPDLTAGTPRAAYMQSQGPVNAYEMLVTLYNGQTWKRGDAMPESLDNVLRGVIAEDPYYSKDPGLVAAVAKSRAAGGFGGAIPVSDVPAGMKVLNSWEGRNQRYTNRIERAMTRDEQLDAAWEMYKRYAVAREYAGGRMDPLFFMTKRESLAKTPVKDIKIMRFKPRPGARGYRVSSLGEWRVHTGKAVKYAGLAEAARG